MPKRLQENLKLPLLFELVSSHWPNHEITLSRPRNHDPSLEQIIVRLSELYQLPPDYMERTLSRGETVFENDVKWAKKLLVDDGELGGRKNVTWTVKRDGVNSLRQSLIRLLDTLDESSSRECCLQVDENRVELVLAAMQKLSAEQLGPIVQASQSLPELFKAAFKLIPEDRFGAFVASMYEVLRELIYQLHVAPFVKSEFAFNQTVDS